MGVLYSLIGCSLNVLYGVLRVVNFAHGEFLIVGSFFGYVLFLELGRSLAIQPSLILLDEPTAMIAPRLSREIYDVIKTLPDAGITVVLVDQNVRQCAAVSEYMYVLDLGRVRAEGNRASFGDDTQLRDMIAEWLDYQVD